MNLGALNLYAETTDAFDHEDVLDGHILAAHAAVALAATSNYDRMQHAMLSRQMLGEATGLLRGKYGLTSDQAFGVTRRISSQHNIKLRVITQQIVQTGALPDDARPED